MTTIINPSDRPAFNTRDRPGLVHPETNDPDLITWREHLAVNRSRRSTIQRLTTFIFSHGQDVARAPNPDRLH
jgi:hypothetical protein